MYYKDDFEKVFEDEVKFHEYLGEVEDRSDWIRVPSQSITVLPAAENADECTAVEGADMKALLQDTREHTSLLLKTPERVYLLGTTALKTLKGRARIEGSALSDVKTDVLADILNKCLEVAKGKALLRFCEGKVRAVLSGDEKDYSILSMPEIYMVSSAYVNGDYEKARFVMGYADHTRTSAVWELEDDKLTKVYQELMEQYGKNCPEKLFAEVRITTSDVGASGANIFYSLKSPGQVLVLGEAMKVRHKDCKTIRDFEDNMESVFDYYREVLRDVMRLCSIHINYPINTMAGIMSKAGFSKKLVAETVESYRAAAGEDPCSAYEVYCGICEVLAIARQEGESESGLLRLEEKIAKCISKRWHDFDLPGDIKY